MFHEIRLRLARFIFFTKLLHFILQMLRYIDDSKLLRSSGYDNQVVTKILIKETDVQHSGSYQCEPGASPAAKVNVYVVDGE